MGPFDSSKFSSTAGKRSLVQIIRLPLRSALLLVAALTACGTLARTDGGAENLPSRQIIPFEKPSDPDDETSLLPFVWIDDERSLDEPSPLVVDDRVLLYAASSLGEQSVIVRAESEDGLTFGPGETILEPELVWEEGWVGAPSILQRQGTLLLWYVGGRSDPAIGLARSVDGQSWTRELEPVLEANAGETLGSPSVVWFDGSFALYFDVTTEESVDEPLTVIVRANSADGVAFERQGTVLFSGVDCENYDGDPVFCWDETLVSAPGARATTSPADRTLVDLWYTGGLADNTGIGFAGSYDGTTFSKYEVNPVVGESSTERAASVVAFDGQLLMYFSEPLDGRRALAIAVQ